MSDKLNRIKELVGTLNNANQAYYGSGYPIMEDALFDKLMEELKELERSENVVFANSPTHNVGSEVVKKINKVNLDHPMLSLDKCHSIDDILKFANGHKIVMSVKLDGNSVTAKYQNGELISLCSRGTGEVGSDLMVHSKSFVNLPQTIPYKGEYIIDGEAVICLDDFENINSKLPPDERFANARNTVAGTLSLLDPSISKERCLRFVAWNVIKGNDSNDFYLNAISAKKYGFDVVPFVVFDDDVPKREHIEAGLKKIKEKAAEKKYLMDGAVISFRDIDYGKSLGRTEKFFRHSIAYKYEDVEVTTVLKDIIWSAGKSKLTPVAIFEPVSLEGTIVEKASLHNWSIVKEFELGIGDKISIFKANSIIPQVRENLTRSNTYKLIEKCPYCGGKIGIEKQNASEEVVCLNDNCPSKMLKKMSMFASKQGMDIDNLSEATLNLLLSRGYISTFKDLYHLSDYKAELSSLPKMGSRSVKKLLDNIEKSRTTTLDKFLTALSIPNVGKSVAKDLSKYCKGDIDNFIFIVSNTILEFASIPGVGITIVNSLADWWDKNAEMVFELLEEIGVVVPEDKPVNNKSEGISLSGMTFVVTGSVHHYKNRGELQKKIEELGGKVSGSVSKNTSYLICNEVSDSGKSKKARELGIPQISEDDFLKMIGETN